MAASSVSGATLTGSFNPIAQGSNVFLSAEGKLDWVHWGLHNDTSLNRKATVTPLIGDFTVVYNTNITWSAAYQYADNFNGYTWSDGAQEASVTNTLTGVYVVGGFNPTDTNGFMFTVAADTTVKTLKVYVGTYAARGRFIATLSDHPTSYTDTSLNNFSNGPGGVYTIQFAANSPNQTLTVRWSVSLKNQSDGNVTLQAATLSTVGANSPPFARIISPGADVALSDSASITLLADASDPDGTIAKAEFHDNGVKVGESTAAPFSLTLSNLTPGIHHVTAVPVDNAGATSMSRAVAIHVHSSGGALAGSLSALPGSIDLSEEGNADWRHWGLADATDSNRKAAVSAQIDNLAVIGTNALQQMNDYPAGFSWNDGTPTATAIGSTTGTYISGITNGFRFSVRATTNLQTLKVYVGLYGGAARFKAWLSDASAPAFIDNSLTNGWGSSHGFYSLTYSAAGVADLFISYSADYLFDQDYGNVALAAAALEGPEPVYLFNPQTAGSFSFSFATEAGRTYHVVYTDSLTTPTWQVLTSVAGNGDVQTVTDSGSHPQRFYRLSVE